ncbi:efflux RND transporter periplasmic adaptor subunit [Tundrisphaera lichenicola]|uniref:efflux RND transporter periplasmic adaptor subunit n=1 Tax=Tundrisphaera lichenicola TaxID=2029860 RepID=UPI003EBA7FD0
MRLAVPVRSLTSSVTASKMPAVWVIGLVLAMMALVAAAELTHDRLFHREGSASAGQPSRAEAPAEAPGPGFDPATTVVMAVGKFESAGIQVEPAREVEMPREVQVTGKIEADATRRVDLHPQALGIVRTVPVLPGTKVRKGDTLVVLDSPDIGSARLLIRERQRALATARVEADWRAEIASNTEAMIDQLRKGTPAQELARTFASRQLGASRGTLLSAYADLENAAHEADKMTTLNQKKIIGEHPLFIAQHARESAQAKFDASLEQIRFDVAQQDRIARQAARNAEEMVVDAAQRLRILGVPVDVDDLLAHPEKASALPSGSEDLTAYPILAPFDATVVSTAISISERVETANILFTLVDVSKVYAVANIPESDFSALPGLSDGKITLTATAYPGRTFEAKMLYTGADVDPITRTVRMVAEAENPDGLLKLGMFATIVLDTRAIEKATTVPLSSVVEFEGKPAVFVPGKEERSFVIRPVKLGRDAQGRQVVTEGIKSGEPVVVAGAFLVKSELILQNETDEE